MRVLRDGTLLCSEWFTDGIHVCLAQSDRSLQHCARVALPTKHRGFDAQLVGNERRLAVALCDGSVVLCRVNLAPVALEKLSFVKLVGARLALFCGDSLLVGVARDYKVQEAVSFSTTGGRLQRERQLIPHDDLLDLRSWCYVEGTLFAWDYTSKQLLQFCAA